jgi:filamentous hemagglutinin family protein
VNPVQSRSSAPFQRPALRGSLLHSVSLSALLVAGAAGQARAGSFKSLNQALASHATAAVTAAASGGGATAANAAGLGAQNLANAAARFRSLNDALQQGATYTGAAIPNGVGPGGLLQAPGVSTSGSNSTLWSGASNSLTQTTSGGITDVTVTQTSSVAALSWASFNVGAKTKLIFNQSAGGTLASSWVAINRVAASINPTVILGDIVAPGKVYILNQNGILFGAGSQVNVGALAASTASIAASQFTTGTNGLISGFTLYGAASASGTYTPSFVNAGAGITVQAGAEIITPAPTGSNGGGSVLLLGSSVENDGIIETPRGQTVLAAGTNFYIEPGFSSTNVTATVIGSQVATDFGTNTVTGTGATALGSATNTGIIVADQGDVSMVGHLVTQAGIILSTTTVDNRGTVHLLTGTNDTTASVVLAPGSITEVLPEDNGQTALDSQRETDIADSAAYNLIRQAAPVGPVLNNANRLADQIGESRIEISTGGSVVFQTGALALAQGGQVAVGASSISVLSGATIDVSGTAASLPASFNSLNINPIVPYDERDSGANRTGGTEFGNVYVDERTLVDITLGTLTNVYTQGGLLEVSGLLGLVGHGIDEWSAVGGQVTLQTTTTTTTGTGTTSTGGTVLIAPGATINLTGGTINYGAGEVQQSYVQAADGEIFNVNDAPGNLVYTGFYFGQKDVHARWGITDTYTNPLLTPSEIYEPAYTIGRDAGTLTITAATGILDGTVDAGVTVGATQTAARPAVITDPFLLSQSVSPLAGQLLEGDYVGGTFGIPFTGNIVLGLPYNNNSPVITVVPDSLAGTVSVAAGALGTDGFSRISFSTGGDIKVAAPVTLADGGGLTLSGATIEVDHSITAHGGQIVLTNLYPGSTNANPLAPSGGGSITLAAGATLNASGQWTNLALDPNNTTDAGYANAGSVTIIGTGGVDLQAGSIIDVSSGGVLSATGKLSTATGGSVSISADIVPTLVATLDATGPVTYESTILGYASGKAGTLSLSAPAVVVGAASPADGDTTLVVGQKLFADGFGDYVLNGFTGLTVDPGLQIDVTRPVYVATSDLAPTGTASSAAYSILLPQLFTQVKGNDALTQRGGASLTLAASIDPTVFDGNGGALTIGAGAHISVDPGQSITVDAYGQVTDLGTLTAHGGTITVANTRYENIPDSSITGGTANLANGLSVWIGDGAVIDASGEAVVMTDGLGRRFGQAQSGGAIFLGGVGGLNADTDASTYAQVIVRPGAVLDVAGAAATVDVSAGLSRTGLIGTTGPLTLAGNGGLIAARSYDGIALDGTLLANGAGAGAAGGTLSMRLDPQYLPEFGNIPAWYVQPSQILISQDAVAVQTQPGLAPGDSYDVSTVGLGRISQQQLSQGGFDTLQLYAQDDIAFDGNVSLKLGRSVILQSGIIGEAQSHATASITAPYVAFVGYSNSSSEYLDGLDITGNGSVQGPASTTATLVVNAHLIDFANSINLGGIKQLAVESPIYHFAYAFGFAQTDFNSSGDIRFDGDVGGATALLASSGDVTFRAAQLYPVSGSPTVPVNQVVEAGLNPFVPNGVNELAGGTITVLGLGGATPAAPFSVGGSLSLFADTIVQDGVIRAPEGSITLGEPRTSGVVQLQTTSSVTLGDGSVTSVSLDGLTVPYGGTVDGVNYLYDGVAVTTFNPVIQLAGDNVTVRAGATVDVSGGGTLAGAGFIAGRGGSVDVNQNPLLNSGSGTIAANTTDPVFAIDPNFTGQYAPLAPVNGQYSAPTQGEQITIAAGEVPGLAAGNYTLLPAYYDLLPGAYRVELTASTITPSTSQSFGNFTTVAAVTIGTANTGIQTNLPDAALITSGAGVRQLSQYDEENYSTFETNAAATFDSPRPLLPQDSKTLLVTIDTPLTSATGTQQGTSSFTIAPGTLDQAPASGGYGATLEIASTSAIELLAPGGAVVPVADPSGTGTLATVGIDAAMLTALDLPRLVIGGVLSFNPSEPDLVSIRGISPAVVVEQGADLGAGDVMLTANSSGEIDISGGGTLAALSATRVPHAAYSSAQGYYFSTDSAGAASPLLGISNAQIVFTTNADIAQGASIDVGAGAVIQGSGSLNFVAPAGTSVQVGQATLSAKYVDLQVADINIGTAANLDAFAGLLPSGLTLTDATLNILAAHASQLILTAQQAVNVIGSATLDSGTTDLVLNTPALYGYGISATTPGGVITTVDAGVVNITAPNFTWGGVTTGLALQNGNTTIVSAAPGGRLAGSVAGNGGTLTLTDATGLNIAAKTIDLGYGPEVQIDNQVQLQRVAVGFGQVTLQASTDITANNQSALTVWQDQAAYGQPGTGGNLALVSPVITTQSGAVLGLTAGGAFTAAAPAGAAPSATGSIATLGGEIDITANSVDTSTAFALPAGKLSITGQDSIDLAAGTDIDLSGRSTKIFDQTAQSNGGTLILQAYAGDAGTITEDAGASVNVSSPGASAGSVVAIASGGAVEFDGSLSGTAASGHTAGSFTVFANTLTNTDTTQSAFDLLNDTLAAGGFTASRSFELASGDIVVDQTITAHHVSLGADAGNIDVSGTINAAGTGPGSISLSAAGTLTLEATAVLDAHATQTARDSYGEEIGSENRAHVTLTSSAGTVVLDGGATIDVGYPDAGNNPQGQVVINAPRILGGQTLTDVAVQATGAVNIIGAQSIDLYAFATYTPNQTTSTVVNGTVVQDNGGGTTAGNAVSSTGTIGLIQIGADNTAYMNQVTADAGTLATQLAGLVHYKSDFNLLPGVLIQSTATGSLTISGDLDFSALRYTDPTALFGIGQTTTPGSGEPGSIVFRSANDLIINGSVSDGFALPPDATTGTLVAADSNGWEFLTASSGGFQTTNQDLLLPQGALAVYTPKGGSAETSSTIYLIGNTSENKDTVFDTSRPIALNYNIVIDPANLNANVVIPFALTVGSTSSPIPPGGWVATSSITRAGVVLYAAGQLIPAGFTFQTGDVLGAGAVLPIQIQTGVQAGSVGQVIPAGTSFSIFYDSAVYLAANVALPANALLPSQSQFVFGGTFAGKTEDVTEVEFRAPSEQFGYTPKVQGYLFPLAEMLPAGDLSWSMSFVSGADLGAASAAAVQPSSSLYGGVFLPAASMTNQAPGSLLIDDQHDLVVSSNPSSALPAFSVIRTGTGDLSLIAGGDVDQSSLYGIYTAGTQDPLGNGQDAQFDSARQNEGSGTNLLPGSKTTSALIAATYQAYYPNDGGDFLLVAQGSVTSATYASGGAQNGLAPSDLVGNWLWRQGSTQLGQPTAWWINFGTLVAPLGDSGGLSGSTNTVALTGFTGFGALGGGNVTVAIGGNAGQMTDRDEAQAGLLGGPSNSSGEGLVIAVGSTGRLLPGSAVPIVTGGGSLSVDVGGTINPLDEGAYDGGAAGRNTATEDPSVNGDVIDLRGDIAINAGAVGRVDLQYNFGTNNEYDPRTLNPFSANDGTPNGGIEVIPGDGTVAITTDRDLVLGGAADPGRVPEESVTSLAAYTTQLNGDMDAGGYTGFTLWQPGTSIALFSAGGNVTPTTLPSQSLTTTPGASNITPTDYRSVYPATLLVTAATGDIIYGQSGFNVNSKGYGEYSLETAPSPNGEVAFLAGGSIYANGYAIDLSGANPAGVSLPTDPAFTSDGTVPTGQLTNIRTGAGTNQSPLALFALEADTPTTDLHENDPVPARFYAADGDIVNFITGETLYFDGISSEPQAQWYIAAKPVWIIASNDIVSSGERPQSDPGGAVIGVQENQQQEGFAPTSGLNVTVYSSGNLFLNTSDSSISLIQAGRDILSTYAYVGGPGTLDVIAGRNLYQAAYSIQAQPVLEFGSLKSLGDNLITGSQLNDSTGAGISVLAGVGAAGPDYAAFETDFLDPAHVADITDLNHDVTAQQAVYEQILPALLLKSTGIHFTPAQAYAYLQSQPALTQDLLVQAAFFSFLQYAGSQEAAAGSPFYKSYALGRQAIDTLFPSTGAEPVKGAPVGYTGTITMYSGTLSTVDTPAGAPVTLDGGLATLYGGTVQVLDPGGQTLFGITGGPAPGNSSGIVTYGTGDIDIYALGNVLLGQSRIFTTGGGNILIWSSTGDINAGIGAKTTVVYNPPELLYDDQGDITETPPADTSGAGIATLQPLPDVAAGDVTLVAPGGTIDPGEAGVRVSGNLTLAAAHVVTSNISVKGSTAGAPTVSVASLGAVEAAGAAAGSESSSAESSDKRNNAEQDTASVVDVEVISIGGTYDEDQKRRKKGL